MHILAVDDEYLALETLERELRTVFPGAAIQGEKDPAAAVAHAAALAEAGKTLSYAFLDIEMEGMSGLETARRIKDVQPDARLVFCTAYSQYALDAFGLFAKGYLLKPIRSEQILRTLDEMVTNWREENTFSDRNIQIQTFGHFEVFVDGKRLLFGREKAKELLAYLVDRRGASVTTEQIAVTLWENEPYNRKLKNRATVIISSLKSTLREAGIEDILVKSWNHLAVDAGKIRCDAYDYAKWDSAAVNAYRGEYMLNYSWAEFTNGELTRMREERRK